MSSSRETRVSEALATQVSDYRRSVVQPLILDCRDITSLLVLSRDFSTVGLLPDQDSRFGSTHDVALPLPPTWTFRLSVGEEVEESGAEPRAIANTVTIGEYQLF